MINFANGSTTELLAMANDFFQSVWPLVVLAVGVPLGFYIIESLFFVIPKLKRQETEIQRLLKEQAEK